MEGKTNKILDLPNTDTLNWRIGELEWEAWMRVLDSAVIFLSNFFLNYILENFM